MNKHFTSIRSIRKFRKIRIFFIILGAMGLVILALQDYSKVTGFGNLFHTLQGLPLLLFGFTMFIITTKQIKRMTGAFISFTDESIEYKTMSKSGFFNINSDIEKIESFSDSIEITDKLKNSNLIVLKDLFVADERKEIKLICSEIDKKLHR
ncbi:MAG: hypothetical protein CVU11_14715 [Bacteroidetes bacterium HGW-Bacteroidetes-6]|nr:MAG: hypothetical protein CVU11_14715 [Bacteroidetes bacterium HGW-Bacteroidetes-6]